MRSTLPDRMAEAAWIQARQGDTKVASLLARAYWRLVLEEGDDEIDKVDFRTVVPPEDSDGAR